jgi:hypothetical protein
MRIDLYTKCVLTVIAACLVWLSLGGPALLTVAQAQAPSGDPHVVISGWVDGSGYTHRLGSRGTDGVPVVVLSGGR